MQKIYILIIFSIQFIGLHAQNFDWAKREGLWAYDYGYGITTDNNGNVYVAGKYEEINANFSGTLIPCKGNHDTYVAQYSPTGTLNWIKTSGGLSGDYATGVATDGANSVYIAGEIEGWGETIWFEGTSDTLRVEGSNDIFLAKYDLSGNFIWAKRAGGFDYEKALGIAYDPTGNVYISGLFRDYATFGGNTTIYSNGNNDMFVAKYDTDGNFLWVQNAGSTGRDEAKGVICDAAGNVYVCGMYSDGITFGTQTLTSPNGYFNTFLAKYSPTGTLDWVKTGGGDYDDVAWAITMDNAGLIYITGEFNAYAMFDAIPLVTSGNADAFVACYDQSGNVQWASQAGGTQPTGNGVTRARGIGCDGTNLYITGQFGGTATFGAYSLVAADSSDVFFAGLSNSGVFLAASSVGGVADSLETLGYESGNTICANASGNVYATGALLDGGDFGSISYTELGRTDIFITKISQLTGVNTTHVNTINLPVHPNPGTGNFSIDLSYFSGQKYSARILNYLGQVTYQQEGYSASTLKIDLTKEEKGIYFIEIKTEAALSRGKIVLQ